MKTMVKLLILVMVMALASPALAGTLKVNCDKGGTITKALENARPGDTIRVTGTCKERVTITTDRLTLDGQGSAILDGGGGFKAGPVFEGVVTIDGARGVTITGFTIQHGPDGITCKRSAACLVRNSILQDNADEGLQVSENSTAEVTDSTFRRNGEWGIVVFDSSNVLFQGTVVLSDNAKDGLGVFFASSAASFSRVAIKANNNGQDGILIGAASNFNIGRGGGTVATYNNKRNGFTLFNSGSLQTFSSKISVEHNGGKGIYVGGNSSLRNFGATYLVKNNKGAGLAVDDGGSVNMKGATITDNGTDVALSFGAHATFKGNTLGTITCDTSSMIRGDTACPK